VKALLRRGEGEPWRGGYPGGDRGAGRRKKPVGHQRTLREEPRPWRRGPNGRRSASADPRTVGRNVRRAKVVERRPASRGGVTPEGWEPNGCLRHETRPRGAARSKPARVWERPRSEHSGEGKAPCWWTRSAGVGWDQRPWERSSGRRRAGRPGPVGLWRAGEVAERMNPCLATGTGDGGGSKTRWVSILGRKAGEFGGRKAAGRNTERGASNQWGARAAVTKR